MWEDVMEFPVLVFRGMPTIESAEVEEIYLSGIWRRAVLPDEIVFESTGRKYVRNQYGYYEFQKNEPNNSG